MLRSPIDGHMYSSAVEDVGVGGAMALLEALSSVVTVAKGVEGSDDASSELMGSSAPSSTSFNFANAVSFSSLINII